MKRKLLCLITLGFAAMAGEPKSVTWTGWFSDAGCAAGRVKAGLIESTNPECAKRCIEQGAAAVFISENTKAMYTVKGYSGVVEDLIYHVEVEGRVDEAAKTIEVLKVKQLEVVPASCGRPTKK
jgi:hypothetical protein